MKSSQALDFDFLRAEGIKMLQKMSGNEWTDYNLHDPGVTILEYLCFAITDLAYRTSFKIEDLISQPDGTINYTEHSFLKPAQALTSGPVTLNDFRKLFLDEIEEIANVWIYPMTSAFSSESIKGLYEFYVQVSSEHVSQSGIGPVLREKIRSEIQSHFVANRNLCEDASKEIHILEPYHVIVNAVIVINQERQPEGIMAQVYDAIETFLNPKVHSYTERELLNKGYSIDEIYTGPMLARGFIPDIELKPRNLYIDPSDLTTVISNVKGVVAVKELTINGFSIEQVKMDIMQFPYFNMSKSKSGIRLFCNDAEISVRQSLLEDILENLRERADKQYVKSYSKIPEKSIKGEYIGSEYDSIQNIFPAIYGIGADGLSGPQVAVRLAHAKQLKAYLVFFEQVMANYLAQLNGINILFSNKISPSTYLSQPLSSIPNFDDVILDSKSSVGGTWKVYFDKLNTANYSDFLKKDNETNNKYVMRKHQMLDHLLARFNEVLLSYPVQLFDKLYGKKQLHQTDIHELNWKSGILQHIDQLSRSRSLGFNYLAEKHEVFYDFRKKIYELLYIKNTPDTSLLRVFNKNIKVEKLPSSDRNNRVISLSDSNVREEVFGKITTWSREEFQSMLKAGLIEPYNHSTREEEAVFASQPISFLSHAISTDSYRLAKDVDEFGGYLLLYSGPEKLHWYIVKRFDNYDKAIQGLDELIDMIIKISTDSEGLHLIEHILLRPRITSNDFGFRYYDESLSLMLESRTWYTFKGREIQLQKILDMLADPEPHSLDYWTSVLLQEFHINRLKHQDLFTLTPPDHDRMVDIIHSIQRFIKDPETSDGRFEMIVKMSERVVAEDFFNFRLTVILPEWPARFQDKTFKDFIMEMFQVQTPVHLRLRFYWLSIDQMTVFEAHYVLWRAELKENSDNKERIANANMADFLASLN